MLSLLGMKGFFQRNELKNTSLNKIDTVFQAVTVWKFYS